MLCSSVNSGEVLPVIARPNDELLKRIDTKFQINGAEFMAQRSNRIAEHV